MCLNSRKTRTVSIHFAFRLSSPELAWQPVAHILGSDGCHSSDYALIQLISNQPNSRSSDMTPKGVFVSYLKARSNHLVTQTRIVLWNKEKNCEQNGGHPVNNGGSYQSYTGHWRFYLGWGGNTVGKGTNTDVGLSVMSKFISEDKTNIIWNSLYWSKHCFGEICRPICVYMCHREKLSLSASLLLNSASLSSPLFAMSQSP